MVIQTLPAFVHCINPDCHHPYPQKWGQKFCQKCGTAIQLQGRYVPLRQLGTGGFAITYTVYDLKSQTEKVLKVLLETSPQALRLFEQEASVLAKLRHPGVPRGEPDGFFQVQLGRPSQRTLPCLVMEKINGLTLDDVIDRFPQGCAEEQVMEWLLQALDILQVLHRRQIIHRDLKPANFILRQETQHLVVIDFGGAKQIGWLGPNLHPAATGSSTRLVSPGYSPPEQIAGSLVGPAADFYALGRTMIHLLTGRYPAEMDDPVTGRCRWRKDIKVSATLGDLLDEMISPMVSLRPSSAGEILSRLRRMMRSRKRMARAAAGWDQVFGMFFAIFYWPWRGIWAILQVGNRTVNNVVNLFESTLSWLWHACSDTFLGMLMAGFGGSFGAGLGFWLFHSIVEHSEPPYQFQNIPCDLSVCPVTTLSFTIEPVLLLFAFAGLGTALGLTESGSFGQLRRYWCAGIIGSLGYLLGWMNLQAILDGGTALDGMMGFSAIAIAAVALGLGLPKYHLLHASLAAMGTAALMAGLLDQLPISKAFVADFLAVSTRFSGSAGWQEFWVIILFFGFLGCAGSFCLGMIHHIFIPFLRCLGFR
jgi:hypothetical protein